MSSEDLATFVESVTGESHLRVEDDFGDGFVRLRSAEAERRQAKHDIRSVEDIVIEMLRNARDAHAHSIYVATGREGDTRKLVMLDDGDGVPEHMRERIFEARVTSKLDTVHMDTWGVHGRGMALYAIKENAKTACIRETLVGGGSSFVVETDATKLSEKTDQSTRPQFVRSAATGTVTVRGPRNIVRTATEFAYIDRATVQVYIGSAIEIAATLWAFGRSVLSKATLAFCNDPSELPVLKRLAVAGTPEEFAEIAASLGLQLSSRSARRIMDGQIQPLQDLASQVVIVDENAKPAHQRKERTTHDDAKSHEPELYVDPRSLKIAPEDLAAFREGIARAYADLAEAYYLDANVTPVVSVQKNGIRITIPVVMER